MSDKFGWKQLDRKLVAILRGLEPEEAEQVIAGLMDCGFQAIEIPLNSPEPFKSIEIAARLSQQKLDGQCLIGAGTVLSPNDVQRVADCGGNLIVSPNTNPAVIEKAVSLGMICMPGVFTPTEAHLALAAGASGLKFFPASVLKADGIKAIKTILPAGTDICAVGGVGPEDFAQYKKADISGFGLGSNLFKPGLGLAEILKRARQIIEAYDRC